MASVTWMTGCSVLAALPVALMLSACSDEREASAPRPHAIASADCATPGDAPVRIDGGTFVMGQEGVYREEGPVRQTRVDGFWIDRHEVTNRQFAAFVAETGYITVAEEPVDPAEFGLPRDQIPDDMLKPGSAVFTPPARPSQNYADWWKYVPGANWKRPYGPEGSAARPEEPVVHLAWRDMKAYADWRKGRLPTEAEWEFAAKAGKPNYTDQPRPDAANTWQGAFPMINEETDGFKGIAPAGCFRPNAYGLYDMVGNAWEMTSDYFRPGLDPNDWDNPRGPSENQAYDPLNPQFPTRVIKGGSYLCAPNYCQRYRPAARSGRDTGLGASNVGFRLVYDEL